jgi:hypothetical protein
MLTSRFTARDPMYGPAARCKKILPIWRMYGLASMYPASDWSALLRAIMDISAHAISLAVRPRPGHSGHQCSHAPGRPILHFVSSSRRPRRVTGVGATSSTAPHPLQFLCSCLAAVPSSRPSLVPWRRAQGAVKAGRRAWLVTRSSVARPRLDGPEHGATLKPIGPPLHPS